MAVSKPASPDRVCAYGAHLLAMDHANTSIRVHASPDAYEYHSTEAQKWLQISEDIKAARTRYIPADPDHTRAYQRALKELKP